MTPELLRFLADAVQAPHSPAGDSCNKVARRLRAKADAMETSHPASPPLSPSAEGLEPCPAAISPRDQTEAFNRVVDATAPTPKYRPLDPAALRELRHRVRDNLVATAKGWARNPPKENTGLAGLERAIAITNDALRPPVHVRVDAKEPQSEWRNFDWDGIVAIPEIGSDVDELADIGDRMADDLDAARAENERLAADKNSETEAHCNRLEILADDRRNRLEAAEKVVATFVEWARQIAERSGDIPQGVRLAASKLYKEHVSPAKTEKEGGK